MNPCHLEAFNHESSSEDVERSGSSGSVTAPGGFDSVPPRTRPEWPPNSPLFRRAEEPTRPNLTSDPSLHICFTKVKLMARLYWVFGSKTGKLVLSI